MRLFQEYQAVEAAFQQMLIEAIDDVYLEAIRDANTNSINLSTYDIIQYLYDNNKIILVYTKVNYDKHDIAATKPQGLPRKKLLVPWPIA